MFAALTSPFRQVIAPLALGLATGAIISAGMGFTAKKAVAAPFSTQVAPLWDSVNRVRLAATTDDGYFFSSPNYRGWVSPPTKFTGGNKYYTKQATFKFENRDNNEQCIGRFEYFRNFDRVQLTLKFDGTPKGASKCLKTGKTEKFVFESNIGARAKVNKLNRLYE